MLSDGLISDYSELWLLVLLDPQAAKFRCRIPQLRSHITDEGGRSGQQASILSSDRVNAWGMWRTSASLKHDTGRYTACLGRGPRFDWDAALVTVTDAGQV